MLESLTQTSQLYERLRSAIITLELLPGRAWPSAASSRDSRRPEPRFARPWCASSQKGSCAETDAASSWPHRPRRDRVARRIPRGDRDGCGSPGRGARHRCAARPPRRRSSNRATRTRPGCSCGRERAARRVFPHPARRAVWQRISRRCGGRRAAASGAHSTPRGPLSRIARARARRARVDRAGRARPRCRARLDARRPPHSRHPRPTARGTGRKRLAPNRGPALTDRG